MEPETNLVSNAPLFHTSHQQGDKSGASDKNSFTMFCVTPHLICNARCQEVAQWSGSFFMANVVKSLFLSNIALVVSNQSALVESRHHRALLYHQSHQ